MQPLSIFPSLQNAFRSTSNSSLGGSFVARHAQFRQTLLRVGGNEFQFWDSNGICKWQSARATK
jgi:hypothetical protein